MYSFNKRTNRIICRAPATKDPQQANRRRGGHRDEPDTLSLDSRPDGHGTGFHWHPYTETWAKLHGSVRIETKHDELAAYPGDIVTLPATMTHRFRGSGTGKPPHAVDSCIFHDHSGVCFVAESSSSSTHQF